MEFSEFFKSTDLTNFDKVGHLNNLINFKKNSGFFKRDNKFNSVVLNRLQGLKSNPYKTPYNFASEPKLDLKNKIYRKDLNKFFLSKYLYKKVNRINYESKFNSKNMDIKIKSK
jgi:hypothetical protein